MSILTPWITLGHLFSVGELSDLWGGWLDLQSFDSVTFAYGSADSPTFVMTSNVDLTGILQPGMRVRLVQTTPKYFIVTAVGAYAAGTMNITLLAPNDGTTLANAAITACAFSSDKAPFGFPTNATKWVWKTVDTTRRNATSAVSGTWYNLGAISLVVPIGLWRFSWSGSFALNVNVSELFVTASTANNAESDTELTATCTTPGSGNQLIPMGRSKTVLVAAKQTYYMNAKTDSAASPTITAYNDLQSEIVLVESAYL